MDDELIYILNNETSVIYNVWYKCLETTILDATNQNSIQVLKVFDPTNKIT